MDISKVCFTEKGRAYIPRDYRREYGELRICPKCKEKFFAREDHIRKHKSVYCSNKCQMALKYNAKHFNGKLLSERGYVLVKLPNVKRMKSGYSYEHRIVIEMKIGRLLNTDEVVHHIDGDKTNNRLENLMLFPIKFHYKENKNV